MAFLPVTTVEFNALSDLAASATGQVLFGNAAGNGPAQDALLFWDNTAKHLSVGVAAPTAVLHLPAGTAVVGTAPLKINPSGIVLAVPEPGAVETDAVHIYWTNAAGTRLQLDDPAAATLAQTYSNGTGAADQTLTLVDPKGGVTIDGSGVGFTATNALAVNGAAAGTVLFPRVGGLTVLSSISVAAAPGAVWNEVNFQPSTITLTGGPATATVLYMVNVGAGTINGAGNTVTDAYNLHVGSGPIGTATRTRSWSLGVDGAVQLQAGLVLGTGLAPPAESDLVVGAGAVNVSAANSGRLGYLAGGTQQFMVSVNTAAYVPILVGPAAAGFTQGSVPFAGATGQLSQDNAKFFWDAANARLGIGATSPTATLQVAQAVVNAAIPNAFRLTGGAHTAITLSSESIGANFDFSATKQWATGALTTQREVLLQAPTYAFVGASVITTAATLAITNSPQQGLNATITNAYALWVQAGITNLAGKTAIGVTLPTATLHLAAVTAAAGTASLKIDAGTLLGATENGAVESDGTNLWWTDGTGTRRQLNNAAAAASTLAATYNAGAGAADQTMTLTTAKAGVTIDGSGAGFAGTNSLAVNGAASSTVLFPRLGGLTVTQGIVNTGVPLAFSVTGGAHTAITLSTEDIGANFNFSATKQWATGALTTQREVVFQAPTYAFVGASVITNAATVAITNAPIAGTSATITNSYALWVQNGQTKLDAGNLAVKSTAELAGLTVTATNTSSANSTHDFSGIHLVYTINQSGTPTSGTMGLKIEATETNLLGAHQFAQFYNGALSIFSFDNWGGQAINQYINHYSTGNPPGALVINLQENGTGLNAGTELSSVQFILNANKQWSTGAITNQREFYIQAPTYSFVGASTIATAATVAISGAPLKGTNATLTNTSALLLQGTYTITTASTTVNELAVVATFNSSANNGAFCAANLRYTVNQTGTASGTISGLLVNATETAVLGTHNLLNLQIAAVSRFTVDRFGNTTIAQVAEAALVPTALTVTGGAHTNITLSTEDVGINFNLSATKQWATGALATQREVLVQAPTYAFVGASTLTTAVTFDITGAPVAGANATITNSYALRVEAGSSQFVPTKTVVAAAGSVWHGLDVAAATLTVTGATTPITALTFLNVGQPTVTAASAVVTTDFYVVRIAAAAFTGAGPASATRSYSLAVDGNVKFGGGQTIHGTDVNIAGPYTVLDTDFALEVRRTATAAITINLPSIAAVQNGRLIPIIDSGYNAAVNNITIARNGADAINNVAGNYIQNVSGSTVWLKANSTTNNWEIV